MIELLLLYIVFSISSTGLAMLYLFMIRKGQLFSFMQVPLNYLSDKKGVLAIFLYKSMGGCEVCTIQRFADVSFIVIILISSIHLHFLLWFFIYCLFGGMVFYASQIMNNAKKSEPKKTTQNIEL